MQKIWLRGWRISVGQTRPCYLVTWWVLVLHAMFGCWAKLLVGHDVMTRYIFLVLRGNRRQQNKQNKKKKERIEREDADYSHVDRDIYKQ